MTHVLGIDPGFASRGWAVMRVNPEGFTFVTGGIIETKKTTQKMLVIEDDLQRTDEIVTAIEGLLVAYEPRAIVAEAMSYPRNARSAALMCLSWGVLTTFRHIRDLPLVLRTPQAVKKALCGVNSASKQQIEDVVAKRHPSLKKLLADTPKTKREHLADAVAAVESAAGSEVIRTIRRLSA